MDITGVLASAFPFLLGRAFIEAVQVFWMRESVQEFPFLLGRAFIEAGVNQEVVKGD